MTSPAISHPRKTKIIATLGPGSESPETITQLLKGGVNVFRLNMSHAKHDWVRRTSTEVRRISKDLGLYTALLLDTQGAAIRTGQLPQKLNLKVGDTFTFTVRGEKIDDPYSVDVNYDDLGDDLNVGDILLVDNGVIRMKVLALEGNQIRCEVLTEGVLGNLRHINLPGVKVNLPALTKKDLADIDVGIECGVDFVALSFVREAKDISQLRHYLAEKGAPAIRIIAKIEDQSAVANFDEIRNAADVIMVARGDLGIECPYEELPIIQRRLVKSCLLNFKPVIVATHLLESMITNPIPTRAEVTDVANVVFEQADALMLSGETATGRYPLECIAVLDRVATRTERSGHAGYSSNIIFHSDRQRVVATAVSLANEAKAVGLCVFTRQGNLAVMAAGLRPRYTRIFAFAPSEKLCQWLSLHYGIVPILSNFGYNPDENIINAQAKLKHFGLAKPGDRVVIVTDMIAAEQRVDGVVLHSVT